jgi:hypothetical protein
VNIPESTQRWLNEFHDWDDAEGGGWSFFACCSSGGRE